MKKLKPLLLCASIIFFSGCAGLNENKFEDLNRRISTLNSSLESTNVKIEDLNNKILLLNEKADASRQTIEKLRMEKESSLPVAPPEGLKVVNLGPDSGKNREGENLKKPPVITPSPIPPSPPEAPVSDGAGKAESPEDSYKKGLELFNAGKFPEARKVFLTFVKSHPAESLTNNARYWIGETYYSEKKYEKAIERFKEVADKYPDDNKAPDCLLKAGFSYMELNNIDKAAESLEKLVKLYPDTEAADKAKKTLKKLSNEKKKGSK